MTVSYELDSGLAAANAKLVSEGLVVPSPASVSFAEVRKGFDQIGEYLTSISPAVSRELSFICPGPHGDIPCYLFQEVVTSTPAPVLVHFHGGGFSMGRAQDWAAYARTIAREAGVAVVCVDYRLAPEHPFPVAYEEAMTVIDWIQSQSREMGFNAEQVVLGGDSAGGNIAAAAALTVEPGAVKGLLQFYAVYDWDTSSLLWEQLAGFGLPAGAMDWVKSLYLGDQKVDWRSDIFQRDLSRLPPVIQIVGELDPLQDAAQRMKERLDDAGVINVLSVETGLPHAFNRMGPMVPRIEQIVARAAKQLSLVFFPDKKSL